MLHGYVLRNAVTPPKYNTEGDVPPIPVSEPRGTRAGCPGVKHWREPKKVQQMGEV
jgi:hypothetical protein